MKKYLKLFYLAMFASLVMVFTSCGDDEKDEPQPSALAGTWNAYSGDELRLVLVLNDNGTGTCRFVEESMTLNLTWNSIALLMQYPGLDDDEPMYYRLKGDKLYLYEARQDFEFDRPEDVAYICTRATGSSENTSGNHALLGAWETSGNIEGEGYVSTAMTFKKDGTCLIEETYRDYPEDSYSVTVNYSVEGSLSSGATLKMWGNTVDGDAYDATYLATISGKKLTLKCISGEGAGDTLTLNRK